MGSELEKKLSDSELALNMVEGIKISLGYPVIDLFITDDQILKMIAVAIRRCQSKACPTFTANRFVSGRGVNIEDLGAEVVRSVYPEVSSGMVIEDRNFFIDMTSPTVVPNYAAMIGARAEYEKAALLDHYTDRDLKMLYVDNYSGAVTIEYTKKNITIDDLDSEWSGWVEAYSGALSKVIEGRIRGKYKIQSGPYEVESDNLISEGTSTISELDSKLESSMGYFNIMR